MKIKINNFELNTLQDAILTYGTKNQEDVAIEEMSELTKAIIKNRRYHTEKTKENIGEEIADVFIMLVQLSIVYGCSEKYDVWDFINEKINRLKQRMEGAGNE